MYRSALVALKPDDPNEELLQFAIDLARRHALHLSGIAILDRELVSPPEAVPLGGIAFKLELDEKRMVRAREQAADVAATFNAFCRRAKVSFDVCCTENGIAPEISRAVQRHDLLLAGHAGANAAGDRNHDSPLPTILRACPRPAIVAPARAPADSLCVVVAYDGSVQAARAVESFVASGFERQAEIQVVAFDEDLLQAQSIAALARDYLASHGYQAATACSRLLPGESVALLIERACVEHRARLLVMGVYGQPIFREVLFGSTTKRLLSDIKLPILLDR